MIRKVVGHDNKSCCFSVPLLLKEDGTKFGKSEKGAVYLDSSITPVFEMYQFFINQPDGQVEELLKKFTFLSKEEIKKVISEHNNEPAKRIAQKELAKQVITDVHGNDEYEKCVKISTALFSGKLDSLTPNELFSALSGTNVYESNSDQVNLCDALIEAGLIKSKSEGRKLITQKAISVNGQLVNDFDFFIKKSNSIENKFSYVKKGKKDYLLVVFK
jgi:tyrosyl-tRNA synthetase